MILNYFRRNIHQELIENWPRGNTYVNHWETPTKVISFRNSAFRGTRGVKAADIFQRIWDSTRPTAEKWIGRSLVEVGLYGIRIYYDGAILGSRKSLEISSCCQ